MKIITLPPYDRGRAEIHIDVEKMICFYSINYNGVSGTEIELANGRKYLTSMADWNLKKYLESL